MLHKDPIIDCLLKVYGVIILIVVALLQQMNYFIEQCKENKEMDHKIENLISDIKKEIK